MWDGVDLGEGGGRVVTIIGKASSTFLLLVLGCYEEKVHVKTKRKVTKAMGRRTQQRIFLRGGGCFIEHK